MPCECRLIDDVLSLDLEPLRRAGEAEGRECTAGALVLNKAGQVFVVRRARSLTFLPNIWDIVGGHVEPAESVLQALAREIEEETGWHLRGEPTLLYVGDYDWQIGGGTATRPHREFDFLVDIEGDLDAPVLDSAEHSGSRWIGPEALALFDENEAVDGGLLRRIVSSALRCTHSGSLSFPHATLFVRAAVTPDIEALRQRWDPAMASQIGAHVTVAYPHEHGDLVGLQAQVDAAASRTPEFRLGIGGFVHEGDPRDGVHLEVDDVDGGWLRLRRLMSGGDTDTPVRPHITLVHPRTSGLGAAAWGDLEGRHFDAVAYVQALAVTAFDGRRWRTVSNRSLTG